MFDRYISPATLRRAALAIVMGATMGAVLTAAGMAAVSIVLGPLAVLVFVIALVGAFFCWSIGLIVATPLWAFMDSKGLTRRRHMVAAGVVTPTLTATLMFGSPILSMLIACVGGVVGLTLHHAYYERAAA